MNSRIFIMASAIVMALPTGALAAPECRLVRTASVDMSIDSGGGVDVPLSINGNPLTLLVDTGGYQSIVKEETVKKLGLHRENLREGLWQQMYGGTRIKFGAEAPNVDFGGLAAHKLLFAIMPSGNLPDDIDGTLAPDILSVYDVEFDFANNKFNLYSQDHCPGPTVYWTTTPYAMIPMEFEENHIHFEVTLDGKKFRALLDTGSTRTMMDMGAARDVFGIKDDDPKLTSKPDEDGKSRSFSYPFKTLALEGLTINNPAVVLVPQSESKLAGTEPEIILGMGVLRQLHLYIAYGERKIYATGATAH